MKNLRHYQHDKLKRESLGEKLETIINEIPTDDITLEEIIEIFEDDGLLLLSIFLSLVFLLPVSIPGVSTIFGAAIMLIGVTRLFDKLFRLPSRISQRTVSGKKLVIGLQKALVWFHKFEKISRPHRLSWLTVQPHNNRINKFAFVIASGLLMAPFGLIPFSNTLPAAALIFISIGEMEKDGVSILLGHLANLTAILYFSVLIIGGGVTIFEGFKLLP